MLNEETRAIYSFKTQKLIRIQRKTKLQTQKGNSRSMKHVRNKKKMSKQTQKEHILRMSRLLT